MSELVPLLDVVRPYVGRGEGRLDLYPASMGMLKSTEHFICLPIIQDIQTIRRSSLEKWPFADEESENVFRYLPLQDRAALKATCRGFYDLARKIDPMYELRIKSYAGLLEVNTFLRTLKRHQVLPVKRLDYPANLKLPPLNQLERFMPQLQVLVLKATLNHFDMDDLMKFVTKPGLKEIHFVKPTVRCVCCDFYVIDYLDYFRPRLGFCSRNDEMSRENLKKLAKEARRHGVLVRALGSSVVRMTFLQKAVNCSSKTACALPFLLLVLWFALSTIGDQLEEDFDYKIHTVTTNMGGKYMWQTTVVNDKYVWYQFLKSVSGQFGYAWLISTPLFFIYALVACLCQRKTPHHEVLTV